MPERRDSHSEAPRRPSSGLSLLGVVAGVTGAAAAVAAAGAAAGALMARRVVTPPRHAEEDVNVLAVWADADGLLVTLRATPDSRLAGTPGVYSLWFDHGRGHAVIGEVVDHTWNSVTRRVLRVDQGTLDGSVRRARVGGWVWLDPASAGFAFEEVTVDAPLGPCPAWLVRPDQGPGAGEPLTFAAAPAEAAPAGSTSPAPLDAEDAVVPDAAPEPPATAAREATGPEATSGVWCIHAHGRASARPEVLRGLFAMRTLGVTSLIISYRNDGEAPSSDDSRYALGATEWEDVEAAIEFALAHGARRVLLFGWSMGGAIVLQAQSRTRHPRAIAGVLLDSPVVDWGDVLAYQADARSLPAPVRDFAKTLLGRRWGAGATGLEEPIDLAELNWVARAGELRRPLLVLHSDDDGFVPSGPSRELAAARPDLVTFVHFRTARHTKLWNHDRRRWESNVIDWVRDRLG